MLKPVSFCSWSTYVNAGLPLFLAPCFGSQSTRVVIISFNWSRYHYVTQSGAQGPEEMCLSLEHQNASKTSEKWVILIALTIALQFRYTFCIPQAKRLRTRKIGLQYKIWTCPFFYSALLASVALRATCRAPARPWLAVIDFQNGEQQSRLASDRKRRNRLQ